MAYAGQQTCLLKDDVASPASPYPLLGKSSATKPSSVVHTTAGYSQVSEQPSANLSPAYPSPAWSSPGLKDGFDDVRIHNLQSMRENDTVSSQFCALDMTEISGLTSYRHI